MAPVLPAVAVGEVPAGLVQPARPAMMRLGVVPRLRAGNSQGGAEGDGDGAGDGEPGP